jgi:hypothetical protein
MAKYLGKVPIPGSTVEVAGLAFLAEEAKGRRNRVGTVLITPVTKPSAWPGRAAADSERKNHARSQRAQH